jgi:hypothetical protein
MRRTVGSVVIAIAVIVLSFGFAKAAAAQSDAVSAIYQSSASIPTNIPGVRTFPAPPAGFNALAASDETLASFGFPPRPDQQANPDAYAKWARTVSAAKIHWAGLLTPHPEFKNGLMRPVSNGSAAATSSSGTTQFGSFNWSGIVNTNALQKWSSNASFGSVSGLFTVPIAQQAFSNLGVGPGNICDSDFNIESTWVGIDGALSGDVLQGGSLSFVTCSPSTDRSRSGYFAWIEWFPSYPTLEVFPVNPGDDMSVTTFDTTGNCTPGFVFVEDFTQQVFGTFQLTWQTGPCLVGNSAEFIVERPAGDSNTPTDLYPLANYVGQFGLSQSSNLKGAQFFPGSQAASTWLVTMFDDTATIEISSPESTGQQSILVVDEGCALSGGCAP